MADGPTFPSSGGSTEWTFDLALRAVTGNLTGADGQAVPNLTSLALGKWFTYDDKPSASDNITYHAYGNYYYGANYNTDAATAWTNAVEAINAAVMNLEVGTTGEVSLQAMQRLRNALITVSTWLAGSTTDIGTWAKNLDSDDADFQGKAAALIQHRLHNDTKWVDGLHQQLTSYHGRSMISAIDSAGQALTAYIGRMSIAWRAAYPKLKTIVQDQQTYYVNYISDYIDHWGLQKGLPNYQLDQLWVLHNFGVAESPDQYITRVLDSYPGGSLRTPAGWTAMNTNITHSIQQSLETALNVPARTAISALSTAYSDAARYVAALTKPVGVDSSAAPPPPPPPDGNDGKLPPPPPPPDGGNDNTKLPPPPDGGGGNDANLPPPPGSDGANDLRLPPPPGGDGGNDLNLPPALGGGGDGHTPPGAPGGPDGTLPPFVPFPPIAAGGGNGGGKGGDRLANPGLPEPGADLPGIPGLPGDGGGSGHGPAGLGDLSGTPLPAGGSGASRLGAPGAGGAGLRDRVGGPVTGADRAALPDLRLSGGAPGADGAGAGGGAGSGAGGVPFFPPMAGGAGGAGEKPKERERQTWLSEDESVWGTGEEAGIAVVGWPGGEQPYDEEPLPPSRPVRPTRRPATPTRRPGAPAQSRTAAPEPPVTVPPRAVPTAPDTPPAGTAQQAEAGAR